MFFLNVIKLPIKLMKINSANSSPFLLDKAALFSVLIFFALKNLLKN